MQTGSGLQPCSSVGISQGNRKRRVSELLQLCSGPWSGSIGRLRARDRARIEIENRPSAVGRTPTGTDPAAQMRPSARSRHGADANRMRASGSCRTWRWSPRTCRCCCHRSSIPTGHSVPPSGDALSVCPCDSARRCRQPVAARTCSIVVRPASTLLMPSWRRNTMPSATTCWRSSSACALARIRRFNPGDAINVSYTPRRPL